MKELIKRAKEKDPQALEEILEKFKPLILASIKKYYYRQEEFQDLVQEGYLRTIELIDDYDLESGAHFPAYLKEYLRYYYLDKNKKKEDLPILNKKGQEGGELIDQLASLENIEEDLILKDELASIDYKLLSQLEYMIIKLYYFQDKSMVQISEITSIPYRTLVNGKTRALKKLRQAYQTKKN